MAIDQAASVPGQIGRYRIIKPLGQGGMGSVYLAEDPQLDRLVALKVPNLGTGNPQVRERFEREAKAAANLRHANICPVFDIGEHNGTPYLAMAYIDGKSLADYLQTKSLTPKQAVGLVRKLALALQEAHQHGVIHRDLKPSNVMLDKRGEPIIMDFGLARRLKDARLTQSGAILGTPAYMPPEQISGSSDSMGPACDVYSLGVMFYELLTGRVPFSGDAMAMLAQILTEQPPPPSKLKPEIEPVLEQLCLKAMAKKPQERYGSMAEFASALLDYVRGASTMASPEPMPQPEAAETQGPGVRVSRLGGRRSVAQLHRELEIPKDAPAFSEPRRRRSSLPRKGMPVWLWPVVGGGVLAVVVGMVVLIWSIIHATRSDNDYADNNKPPNPPPPNSNTGNKTPKTPDVPPSRSDAKQPDASAPTDNDGWVSLFNGRDLSGWSVAKGPEDKWKAQDGDIVGVAEGNARDRWLLTDAEYGNFVLGLEYKLRGNAKSSAGITFRAMPSDPNFRPLKLMDDGDRSDWSVQNNERTGTMWGQSGMASALAHVAPRQAGWEEVELTVNGKAMSLVVNGMKVQEMDASKSAPNANFPILGRASGRIGLQAHTSIVQYRNIKLKRLTGRATPATRGGAGSTDLAAVQGEWTVTGEHWKGKPNADDVIHKMAKTLAFHGDQFKITRLGGNGEALVSEGTVRVADGQINFKGTDYFGKAREFQGIVEVAGDTLRMAYPNTNDGMARPTSFTSSADSDTLVIVARRKSTANPVVMIDTSMGPVKVELYREKTPETVANFLKYVDDKHYDGTIFHRVMRGFVIQGGGFDGGKPIMPGAEKPTRPPIKNEADKGVSNTRGTIAMARTPSSPDSATSQFFINVADNTKLDPGTTDPSGYCAFGKVIEGMLVVDKIANAPTKEQDQPVQRVTIRSIRRVVDEPDAYSSSPLKPELVALRELPSGQNKSGPWLSGDGLSLYWADKQGSDHAIWRADRLAAGKPFAGANRLCTGHDLTLSADMTEMILVDHDPQTGTAKFALFSMTKGAAGEPRFGPRRKLTEFSGYGFVAAPCLTTDGLTLYAEQFGDRSLPANVRFRRPNRNAQWGKAEAVPIFGLGGGLRFPFVAPDGRYLFGNNDMAASGMVMLSSTGAVFGNPKAIEIPGSVVKGKMPRYSPSTNELFFSESTTGKTADLYVIKNFDPAEVK